MHNNKNTDKRKNQLPGKAKLFQEATFFIVIFTYLE